MPTPRTRSGNPAKRAAAKTTPAKASTAADFKKKTEDLTEMPSGNHVKIKRPGLAKLLADGLISNSLAGIAQQAVDQAKGISQKQQEDLIKDPSKITAMLETFDKIVIATWVDPAVSPDPAEGEAPSEDVLYVGEIDLEDKIFTFQVVSGGSQDLERFRKELGQSVAGLSAG